MKKILKGILSVLNQLLDEARVHNSSAARDKGREDDTSGDERFSFRLRKWLKANARCEDKDAPYTTTCDPTPIKREGWVNVVRAPPRGTGMSPTWAENGVYDTEAEAIERRRSHRTYLASCKIEWEESSDE
jgi:hypothetical protein